MNVDPTLGDGPVPDGGLYLARNIKLIQFIAFAYKLTQVQLQSVVDQVPWTAEDRFDIEARTEGHPTKDQYRLMMQSLLADRFKLTARYETRMLPVYQLFLAKSGELGAQLRLHHADDPVCASTDSAYPVDIQTLDVDQQGFPLACGGPLSMVPSGAGRMKSGGRDVPMRRFAAVMTGVGVVDRPMVDHTGIKGNIDYVLEWQKVPANAGPGAQVEGDDSALTFRGALKAQLGIKMVSAKEPVQIFQIDHIEHPAPN